MKSFEIRTTVVAFSSLALLALAACDKVPSSGQSGVSPSSSNPTPPMAQQQPGDSKVADATSKATQAMDDTSITAAVKAGILAEPGLKVLQIDVATQQGVVTLSGSVDTALSVQKAEQVASTVQGVKSVDNKLTVKTG